MKTLTPMLINRILALSAPILPIPGNAAAQATDTAWIGVLGQLGTIGILIYFLYIVWSAFQNLQKAQTKSI